MNDFILSNWKKNINGNWINLKLNDRFTSHPFPVDLLTLTHRCQPDPEACSHFLNSFWIHWTSPSSQDATESPYHRQVLSGFWVTRYARQEGKSRCFHRLTYRGHRNVDVVMDLQPISLVVYPPQSAHTTSLDLPSTVLEARVRALGLWPPSRLPPLPQPPSFSPSWRTWFRESRTMFHQLLGYLLLPRT